MSGQSKKSWPFWLPDWLAARLHVRQLRRSIRALADYYGPLAAEAKGDKEQGILAEWSFEASWPESELADLETQKLRGLADRWGIEAPASEYDHNTGHWYIPDPARRKLRREIQIAKREMIRWWIQLVVTPHIALVSSATALLSLFYRLK